MEEENLKNIEPTKIKFKKNVSSKQNKYMIKLIIIVTVLNIVLTYMNIQKYFFDPDKELHDTTLSHFRKK